MARLLLTEEVLPEKGKIAKGFVIL